MAYDVDNDPYINENSGILRNKLGIKTQNELNDAEARITSVEITVLTSDDIPPYDEFTEDLFLRVHKQLFEELYDWAGKLRTVELSKGETSFARLEHLATSTHELFKQLNKDEYLVNLDFEPFVEKLAHYYGEFIVLHPFRDGNGRAIRTFLAMLADSIGWHIAWDEMNAEQNIVASIAAYNGKEEPLQKILQNIVSPIDIFWGRDPYEFI